MQLSQSRELIHSSDNLSFQIRFITQNQIGRGFLANDHDLVFPADPNLVGRRMIILKTFIDSREHFWRDLGIGFVDSAQSQV
jgi:hypothetical protein